MRYATIPNRGGWSGTGAGKWLGIAALLLILISDIRQTHWKGTHNPNDFVTLYAGSFCLTHGCNPYNVPDLEAVLEEKRGTTIRQDWSDQLPIYPPSTLILLLPLSVLSFSSAMVVWYSLSLLTYLFGLCWLYFVSPVRHQSSLGVRIVMVLLGAHFPKMLQCLGFGNPSLVVTGILLGAVADEAESRSVPRAIALAIACVLKPPLAIPLTALVLFRQTTGRRRTLGWLGGFFVGILSVLLYVSRTPGMAHWRADLGQNIALGERGGMNPSLRASASNAMLHIATLPGYFTSVPHVITAVSLSSVVVLGGLCVFLIYKVRERPSAWNVRGYLLAAATVSVLTLLPVYHRFCDIGLLLLVVPWVAYEFAHRPGWRAWVCVPLLALLYFSWERRIPIDRLRGTTLQITSFFYFRGDALLVFLLGCVLLSAMYALASNSAHGPEPPMEPL